VNQNKNADALSLMDERGGLAEQQPEEMARLYFKTGQYAKAEQEANKLLQTRAFDRIPNMASVLVENGSLQEAASLLQTAIARCKDTQMFYQLQSALLDLLPEDAPQTLIDACFARLRSQRAASRAKGAERRGEENSYYNALERFSKKFHREEQFAKDLEDEWRGGAGSSGAGLRLVRLYRDDAKKEKLRAICEALLQRADFNSAMMGNMRGALEAAKQYDLLEKGWRILCEREPLKNDLPVNLARALNSSGRKLEAAEVLEKLGARYVFATEVAATVADEYARMKDFPAAQKWYEVAILQQEPRERPSVFFDYARLLLDRKDFAAAKRILLAVFRGSNSADMDLLVRYFIESDRGGQIEAEIREFALTQSQTAQAAEVLKRFIADTDDSAAKERAKKILSKIQPAPAAP
jgi:tetratricopeptide (TPR) repeat protein